MLTEKNLLYYSQLPDEMDHRKFPKTCINLDKYMQNCFMNEVGKQVKSYPSFHKDLE